MRRFWLFIVLASCTKSAFPAPGSNNDSDIEAIYAPIILHTSTEDVLPGVIAIAGKPGLCDVVDTTGQHPDPWMQKSLAFIVLRSQDGALTGTFAANDLQFEDKRAPLNMASIYYPHHHAKWPSGDGFKAYTRINTGSVHAHKADVDHRAPITMDLAFSFDPNGPRLPASLTFAFCDNLAKLGALWR